jgi:hypothetical protein
MDRSGEVANWKAAFEFLLLTIIQLCAMVWT